MILALTGTNGAGKGKVVEYLVQQKGFTHYSARDLLLEEIRKRGLPEDRTSMGNVGNELRRLHHPAYTLEILHQRALAAGGDAVIESIRALGEATFLKEQGIPLIAIDADRKLRYERVVLRGSSTDQVDFDTWVQEEDRELSSREPWSMNLLGVVAMADVRIENEGSIEELHTKIDSALAELGAK